MKTKVRKTKTPRMAGHHAPDEVDRKTFTRNVNLANGRRAVVDVTTVYGAHPIDGPQKATYRGTLLDLTIFDRDGRRYTYDGYSWLKPADNQKICDLIRADIKFKHNAKLVGLSKALSRAMRSAAHLFKLVPPNKYGKSHAEYHQELREWKLQYRTSLTLWKNDKALIWLVLLPALATHIQATIDDRKIVLPPANENSLLLVKCANALRRYGPLTLSDMRSRASTAPSSSVSHDEVFAVIFNNPSVFKTTVVQNIPMISLQENCRVGLPAQ